MSRYQLEGDKFIFKDYEKLPAFSSFLPGLAGVRGIPLWVFYTNRGQGINSFGIHHKGNAIMEFNPANTAYENTAVKGFRTFLRRDGKFFEPFCSYDTSEDRTMCVEKNRLTIEEVNKEEGLKIKVSYFVLPTENIGALVRNVEIMNISGQRIHVEGIDGLPKIIPYGIQNGAFKEMSNLFKSWTEIRNIDRYAPYYTMRASSDDSAEVSEVKGGYFYCTVADGCLQPVIYDAEVIFDYETSLVTPVVFREEGLEGVRKKKQCFANKVPCGFTAFESELAPEQSTSFTSYIGYAGTIAQLNEATERFCKEGYETGKEEEAVCIAKQLVSDVRTATSDKVFDQYMEQCYLDNFLRGGYPYVFRSGEKNAVVHLFSRKHGDPERDYNFFSIAGEYFSQGNGNFRDVCQNRRNDVFFHPEIGDFNVWSFFNLIQLDGYNPLEIRPCTFRVRKEHREEAKALIAAQVKPGVSGEALAPLKKLLAGAFTPGQVCSVLAEHAIPVQNEEELVAGLLGCCEEQLEAGFGEGYWSDHWDYLMDLVDNYLLIFPDKKQELLLGRHDYRFYDSVGVVRPRKETCVLSNGKVRQYGSLYHSTEKEAKEGFTAGGTNWVKDKNGAYLTTTLLGKMLTLAVNKFLLLDEEGMGIEMEGGKPGWNDAMNGLPGLFGSGMPETFELARLLSFLKTALSEQGMPEQTELPKELFELIRRLEAILEEREALGTFGYWEKAADLREQFRAETAEVSGEVSQTDTKELLQLVCRCLAVVEQGIEKAWKLGNGIMPTYFTYEAVEYEERKNEDGTAYITPYGLPGVIVKKFRCHVVPPFLEGPARMLSCVEGHTEEKHKMYEAIRESDMYDKKLKMYKTSVSIEEISMEHGRVRAFTPGWLERESVFLHMEYKYLLGLLQSGLTEEYYTAMKDALIPFQKPEVYGRSTLENSSFLASSVNPDEKVHGRGFVARLSGSTTEMLSMWIEMFLGDGGFSVKDGTLVFTLAPKLADWLFDENGEAAFTLMSRCKVVYKNPTGKSTFGTDVVKVGNMKLFYDIIPVDAVSPQDGVQRVEEVSGNCLKEQQAMDLRNGKITKIEALLA
ncbi:MAG: hypothetical protein ACI4FZ_07070 [Lachnospiraceae bacterium]